MLLLFSIFLGLMIVGLPIVFALLAAPMIDIIISGDTTFLTLIAQSFGGVDSFPLMALPFLF